MVENILEIKDQWAKIEALAARLKALEAHVETLQAEAQAEAAQQQARDEMALAQQMGIPWERWLQRKKEIEERR